MKNIVLARIDDRLIHGQVITAWIKQIKAQTILIIDDDLVKNVMMQRIYKASAPTEIKLHICNFEDGYKYLSEAEPSRDVIILVKVPQIFYDLITRGIVIKNVILGGMGSNAKRKQLVRNVFASESERMCMKNMIELGIPIVYQLVPDDKPVDISKLL